MPTRLTVLVENTAMSPGLLGEHGLSMLIERDGHVLLFDTGQGMALPRNAEQLGVPWDRVERMVLSHGHYDHTGGLAYALAQAPQARVVMHRAADGPHYSRRAGVLRDIGLPPEARAALEAHAGGVMRTERPVELLPGVWVSGSIPRVKQGPPGDEGLFSDAEGTVRDTVPDDQVLWLDTAEGLVVLLGCAHSGLANILEHVRACAPGKPVSWLVGGMHLAHADAACVNGVVDLLENSGVGQVAPGHCTGWAAQCALRERFGARFHPCFAGARFEFR